MSRVSPLTSPPDSPVKTPKPSTASKDRNAQRIQGNKGVTFNNQAYTQKLPEAKNKNLQGQGQSEGHGVHDLHHQDSGPKTQAIVFIVVMGLLIAGGGSALTWVAVHTGLDDFYILGPGGIVIGAILLTVAAILVGREWLKKRRRQKELEDKELEMMERVPLNDYNLPQTIIPALPQKEPINKSQLYGQDDPVRARKVSMFISDAKVAPSGDSVPDAVAPYYEKEMGKLPPPSVTYPHSISDSLHDKSDVVYTLPIKDNKTVALNDRQVSSESLSKVQVYVPEIHSPSLEKSAEHQLPAVYEEPQTKGAFANGELYEMMMRETEEGSSTCSVHGADEQARCGCDKESKPDTGNPRDDTDSPDTQVHDTQNSGSPDSAKQNNSDDSQTTPL